MDNLDQVVAKEIKRVQKLLDDSEKWGQSVQIRILELLGDSEEQVCEREVKLNNDDLHSLLEVDDSFSKMYIDLDFERPEEDEIAEQLQNSADVSAMQNREDQLAMIGIHGSQMITKLVAGFQSFKNSVLKEAKVKHEKFIDELDYIAVTDKLKKKAATVRRIRDELESKREMLGELVAEEKMTAEEKREKYENEVTASRVKALTSRIEDQKYEIERTSQKHDQVKERVEATKTALAQTLYDLKEKEDKARRFGGRKKVTRLANDGSMVFSDNVDDDYEKDAKKALQNRYASSLTKIETLLKDNSSQAKEVIEKEQNVIKLRSEYDAVVNSEEFQALQRLISSIDRRKEQIEDLKKRISQIRMHLKNDFGVDEQTLDTATKDEILKSRHQRIFRRKERWDKAIESMFDPTKANRGKSEKKPIHRPVRVFGSNDLVAMRKFASTLRSAATQGLRSEQNTLISEIHRAIPSESFEKKKIGVASSDLAKRESYLKRRDGCFTSPAALCALGLNKEGSEDVTATMLQDFGFQAIVEQLGVLDNLLKDGSRRHIDAAMRAMSAHEDRADVEDKMQEVVKDIKKNYKIINKARRRIRWMNAAIKELNSTRDETRSKFLRMIGGRDDMPKTIYSRGGEVEFLNLRIPDLMAEINVVKEALEHEQRLLQEYLNQQRKRAVDEKGTGTDNNTKMVSGENEAVGRASADNDLSGRIEANLSHRHIDSLRPDVLCRDPPEKEDPNVYLVDSAAGEPITSIKVGSVTVGQNKGHISEKFQSASGNQSINKAMQEEVVQEVFGEATEHIQHTSLAGSGLKLTKRATKPAHKNLSQRQRQLSKRQTTTLDMDSQNIPRMNVSPAPSVGFMSKVPSMRSSASAISELSADPSDPFNQALDDNSDWRLNLGYATEDSSFNVGELRTLRASDKARSDELLPVHVINLVVEDHDFATSPHKSPRVKVPKKPFRLQLTPNIANLHFGGHRTYERDLDEASTLRALTKDLPSFYTELQDALIQGHNPRHWSIPAMPSMLPEDPPLVAKALQNKKERSVIIHRIEKLLARLDAEKKAKETERRKAKEAMRLREAARRKEEEDVGIFEDLDIDDNDSAIVVLHDNVPEPSDSDSDSDYDGHDNDDQRDRRTRVHDILSLSQNDSAKSWVDTSRQVERRNDWIVGLVERYNVALDPRSSLG